MKNIRQLVSKYNYGQIYLIYLTLPLHGWRSEQNKTEVRGDGINRKKRSHTKKVVKR